MAERVFVYGTLRRGACNEECVAGALWLGSATVRGRLYSLGWYPGLVLDPEAGEVVGDVFEISQKRHLIDLDRYEGCGPEDPEPNEYKRVRAEVTMADGPAEAWLWVWQTPAENEFPELLSGDWLSH